MTAFDGRGRLDARIVDALDGIAPLRQLDYLDDVLWQTAHSSQRSRLTLASTWPLLHRLTRRALVRHEARTLQLLGLLLVGALVLAGIVAVVGSRGRVPLPFGLAGNGAIAYVHDGDVYIRDELSAEGRLLIGGDGDDVSPAFSPDGQWLTYATVTPQGDRLMLARADGSNLRELALVPRTGNAWTAWRPDSRAVAFIHEVERKPVLAIAHVDGTPTTRIDMGNMAPLEVAWRPPQGEELLVRVATGDPQAAERPVDFVLLDSEGTVIRTFGLPSPLRLGTSWENSGVAWSPDGATIAYNRVGPGTATGSVQFRLHLIDADGTNARPAPPPSNPEVQESWPVFSPDGRWILVHRWTWRTNGGGQGWLAVMPSNASSRARDLEPRISGGERTGLSMAWSPDATRVLMRSENTREVFSIDPLTGEFEPLPWTTELPSWQRVAP